MYHFQPPDTNLPRRQGRSQEKKQEPVSHPLPWSVPQEIRFQQHH